MGENLILKRALARARQSDETNSERGAPPKPPRPTQRWLFVKYICAALHETKFGPSDYTLRIITGDESVGIGCNNELGRHTFIESCFCKQYWHQSRGVVKHTTVDGYELCNCPVQKSFGIPKESTHLRLEVWHEHVLRPANKLGEVTVPLDQVEQYQPTYGDKWTPQAGQLLKECPDYELIAKLTDKRAFVAGLRICRLQSELKGALAQDVRIHRAMLSGTKQNGGNMMGVSPAVPPDKFREAALASVNKFRILKQDADNPSANVVNFTTLGSDTFAASPSTTSTASSLSRSPSFDTSSITGADHIPDKKKDKWWSLKARRKKKTRRTFVSDNGSIHSQSSYETGSYRSSLENSSRRSSYGTIQSAPGPTPSVGGASRDCSVEKELQQYINSKYEASTAASEAGATSEWGGSITTGGGLVRETGLDDDAPETPDPLALVDQEEEVGETSDHNVFVTLRKEALAQSGSISTTAASPPKSSRGGGSVTPPNVAMKYLTTMFSTKADIPDAHPLQERPVSPSVTVTAW